MVCPEYTSASCLEGLGKIMDLSVRIAGISADIPAEHLLNTNIDQ
jgi:hypothetical protein